VDAALPIDDNAAPDGRSFYLDLGHSMLKQVYFIRHGESSLNADANRLSGISDVPMTDAGRAHCRALSQFFRRRPVEAVYVSLLSRSKETASLVFPHGPAVQVRDELMEFDYGQLDGVSIDELPEANPVAAQWRQSPGNMTFPSGQNIQDYAEVAFKGMHRLISASPASRIACVGHKTMGRLLVAKVIGLDLDAFRAIPMDNCSVTMFAWGEESGFTLRSLNLGIEDLLL
jgi:probable phosphoglycerate mutase